VLWYDVLHVTDTGDIAPGLGQFSAGIHDIENGGADD
jgi:hypothetical protein